MSEEQSHRKATVETREKMHCILWSVGFLGKLRLDEALERSQGG